MASPVPDSYSCASGGVISGGRFMLPPNPELVSVATWPPEITCSMPVVEGYSQYVHPKVLDFGIGGWNGYRYWMANTNYPGTNDQVENPAVFVSSDGTTWQNAGANPVVPVPPGAALGVKYNSDPHLLFDSGTLYLYWRVFNSAGTSLADPRENLRVVSTTDGFNWSGHVDVLHVHEDWNSGLLAPCVSKFESIYYLWSFRDRTTPTTFVLRTSSSPFGPFSELVATDFSMPASAGTRKPWHGDVVKTKGGWALVFSDRGVTPAKLWFAYGKNNGCNWTVKQDPITTVAPDQYRPSLVLNGAGYDLWAANNGVTPRRIERTYISDPQLG